MSVFHDGELLVQRRAGVADEAARLRGMLAPANLDGGIGRFLATRTFAALTARDQRGRLWISPLIGPPGFLDGSGRELTIHTRPGAPLHEVPVGQPIGLIAIDFAKRRRVRVNGTLVAAGADDLHIEADQAYGNCPQYIHPHTLDDHHAGTAGTARWATALTDTDRDTIRRADTFFLGTVHPTRGADASHRGGDPGFVRVEGERLWWPDYPGNNMFNSLGNLAVDDSAAVLVVDFDRGTALHLSGHAAVEWGGTDEGRTGRRVTFTPADIVEVAGAVGMGAADVQLLEPGTSQ